MAYFGGKGQVGVYQAIINQIPPHRVYFELFLGGGSIMKRKARALKSIGYELNAEQAAIFAAERPDVTVHNKCAITALESMALTAEPDWFVFLDPPYLPETRMSDTRYPCELDKADHWRILTALQKLKCPAMITHYPNPLYDDMLADWRQVEFESNDRGGHVRIEKMYMNYDVPAVLHDAQYLGENKDHRQRIKRKNANLHNNILSMDTQAQARVLAELVPLLDEDVRQHFEQQFNCAGSGDAARWPHKCNRAMREHRA